MMKSSDSSAELFADEFNQTSDCHVEYSDQLGTRRVYSEVAAEYQEAVVEYPVESE